MRVKRVRRVTDKQKKPNSQRPPNAARSSSAASPALRLRDPRPRHPVPVAYYVSVICCNGVSRGRHEPGLRRAIYERLFSAESRLTTSKTVMTP